MMNFLKIFDVEKLLVAVGTSALPAFDSIARKADRKNSYHF